jgi:PAS domain S-box-containing protein
VTQVTWQPSNLPYDAKVDSSSLSAPGRAASTMSKVFAFLRVGLIALAAMLLTLLYEAAKTIWLPHISFWQSHAITVVYCTLGALLFSLVIVRLQKRILSQVAQEANFEAVIEHLPGLSCIVRQGRFVRWNSRFQQLLGYSASELSQIRASQTLAEEYRDTLPACMLTALHTAHAGMEAVWRTKSGQRIPCYITGVPVVVGGDACILSMGIDISERQRSQEALRQSEEQYRRLLSNLPDVTWTIDAEACIHYVSRNVEEVLGYLPPEVLGGELPLRASRIHPDDQRAAIECFELLFRENRMFDVEYRVRHKDGRWIWVRSRALRTYRVGNRLLADGVLVDITSQKAAEAIDAQLAAIIRSSIDAVIGMSVDGVIQSWNPAAEAMFGYSPEEAIGRSIAIVIPPERLHELPEVLEKTKRGERIERFDSVAVRKNGTRFNLSLANSPIIDKTGAILGLSLIAHDISRRKQAEEALRSSEGELRKAKNVAEDANQQKTRFLANTSQALRTTMNSILGMSELTLETTLTAEQREYLLTIKTEGDALVTLINDLLDYTRSEFGSLQLQPVPFQLRELVRQTVRPLFADAEQMGLATSFDLAPDVPYDVVGDPARLQQVLLNLAGNAVKYTYEGAIALKAECSSRSQNQVELLFTLSDTGIGIPASKHQQIFEPFINRNGDATRRHGGSGLGLAISSRLVQLMGGRIWLDSEPGRGSTFYFTVQLQT